MDSYSMDIMSHGRIGFVCLNDLVLCPMFELGVGLPGVHPLCLITN